MLAFLVTSGQVTPILFEDGYCGLATQPVGGVGYFYGFDLARERGKERYSLQWRACHNQCRSFCVAT